MPSRPINDPAAGDPLGRISIALGHALRLRIIRALMGGPGSATTLSKEFGDVAVPDLSYHLTVLERCRVVDLCRLRPARGAKERIFELRRGVGWGDVWAALPPPAIVGFQNALLREFAGLAVAALDSQTAERSGTVLSGRPVRTDQQGFAEIGEILRSALAEIDRIADESRGRLECSEAAAGVSAVIGAAAFEAPPTNWWERKSEPHAQSDEHFRDQNEREG